MNGHTIYLDNAATTRTDERVVEAMIPFFTREYGNASSLHSYGTKAKETLEASRAVIAGCLGASGEEIFFTSGGTEANNWALKGAAFANRHRGNHLIVSAIEHDCIMKTCAWLAEQGFYISYLPVGSDGVTDLDVLRKMINSRTILVSVMHANNEIGTIEPVAEIGRICNERGVYFHTDVCQSFGKIPFNVIESGASMVTVNSHKMYGPKGVGALYIRKGTKVHPLLHGGGQENGMRSTTENISGIAGFAKAAQLCMEEMNTEFNRLTQLREKLSGFLFSTIPGVYVNGHSFDRLPGHLSFSFHGLEGEAIRLLLLLDELGIAVSAGSACSSNDKSNGASHVLQAIGLDPFQARGSIRVSMGRFTTEKDIGLFQDALVTSMRSLNSIFSESSLIQTS